MGLVTLQSQGEPTDMLQTDILIVNVNYLTDTPLCMRLCCGPNRGFTIHMTDNFGQVSIITVIINIILLLLLLLLLVVVVVVVVVVAAVAVLVVVVVLLLKSSTTTKDYYY